MNQDMRIAYEDFIIEYLVSDVKQQEDKEGQKKLIRNNKYPRNNWYMNRTIIFRLKTIGLAFSSSIKEPINAIILVVIDYTW
jgi:hypothetical protein